MTNNIEMTDDIDLIRLFNRTWRNALTLAWNRDPESTRDLEETLFAQTDALAELWRKNQDSDLQYMAARFPVIPRNRYAHYPMLVARIVLGDAPDDYLSEARNSETADLNHPWRVRAPA